jgi:hypothetical protein
VQEWVDEDEEIKEELLKGVKMGPSSRGKALP